MNTYNYVPVIGSEKRLLNVIMTGFDKRTITHKNKCESMCVSNGIYSDLAMASCEKTNVAYEKRARSQRFHKLVSPFKRRTSVVRHGGF